MTNEGTYYGYVAGGTTTQASTGTPQLAVKLSITNIASQINGEPTWEDLPTPIERTMFLALSEKAWPYSEEKLKRLGFNGDFENPDFTKEGVQLECKHEEYRGKVTERWNLAGDGPNLEQAPQDMIRTLNARWRAKAEQNRRPATAPKQTVPPDLQEQSPFHGDDGGNDEVPI